MANKDRGLIGIEVRRDELRAVYVRGQGNRPEVASALYIAMPEGGLAHGAITQVNLVSVALRRLLDDLRAPSGVGVVMGVPPEGITVRTLSVPPTPDEELAQIIAGEVEHYRILRSKGSHAFVALSPPVKPPPGTPRSVVIAAAEEQVTLTLGALASEVGVRLAALEPVEFGLLRSVAAAVGTDQSAFAILIGQNSTDLAAFSKGQLWSYRRVEYGITQLLLTTHEHGPANGSTGDDEALLKYASVAMDALSAEIGRSIDYLGREYKEYANFAKLYLCVGDAEVADIAGELSERLSFPIATVPPCSGCAINAKVINKLDGAEGLRYSAAFGLAMRDYLTFSGALPRVDLFALDRAMAETRVIRRNVTGSLVTSVAAVAIGIAGFLLYDHQVSLVNAQTGAATAHTLSLQTETSSVTEKHQARQRQIDVLSQSGVPVVALVDSIATNLDPASGISSLSVAPDGTLTLVAEAKDETSMLHTVEGVQRIPILQNVMVQTFASQSQRGGISFTVAAKALPLSQVREVFEPAPVEPKGPQVSVSTTNGGTQ